jgi:acetoin utilization deacetylase AcuC-like enzyme
MLKVFYSKNQSVRSNSSFSPSAGKPELVVASWKQRRQEFQITDFAPVTRDDLKLVHSPSYVDGVLDLTRSNGFGNTSPAVAKALPWVCGSMVEAALDAFKNKSITISPTSGAHHAGYSRGGGFCTFNFLVLAAIKAHHAGAKKVGIIDLDCHFGNGTQDIIDTLKLDFIKHYTFGGEKLPFQDAALWLDKLPEIVQGFQDCDLIIYNAGVDSHIDDPLGGVLTTEQIEMRDCLVIQAPNLKRVPMVISLAGGYQKDAEGGISKVLELHGLMFNAAWFADKLSQDEEREAALGCLPA